MNHVKEILIQRGAEALRSEVNLAVVDLSRVEPATYDIPFFAKRLGVSRGFAYTQARSGHLAGVPVIKVGSRLLVPRELADRVLRGESVG